jgi:hypothetical protein
MKPSVTEDAISTLWLQEIIGKYDLISFSHKKSALEDLKAKIDAELERKQYLKVLANQLVGINK